MGRRLVAALSIAVLLIPTTGSTDDEDGLDLAGLLEMALQHDGRVLAAHAKLEAYRAQYDRAAWAWFPTIKLQGLLGGPVGARRLACPDDPECVRLLGKDNTGLGNLDEQVSVAVGGKLEARMPLYTFGKISGAKRAARAGIDAGRADIERARQEVALEVRRAWYGWQLANATLDVLEDGEKKIRDAEKKLLKMLDELNEDVTDRDLFKLRYHASQVRTMLLDARKGQAVALAGLRFLTGIADLGKGSPLRVEALAKSAHEIAPRESYLRRAVQIQPELKMLSAAVEASRAQVEIQKAQFYPDFFLAGQVHGSYSPIHDYIDNSLLNRGLTYYSAGLTLGFQIGLDIPQKYFRLEQARAERHRWEIQSEQAHDLVGLEIDRRLEDLKTAELKWKILRRGNRAAKAWMRSNFMSYGVGLANTKDLLDSLTAYAKSRIEKEKAVHDLLMARDRLHATVGEDLSRPTLAL